MIKHDPKVFKLAAKIFTFITSLFLVLAGFSCKKVTKANEATIRELPVSNAESVGLSSLRLSRIQNVVQGYVDRQEIPGAVVLIARRGSIAYQEAFGLMDIEAQKPMRTDSIFRIASMTKPITSVAVMLLYEEGRFSLSDPISKFIPAFKSPKVAVPISSKDRSGFRFNTVSAKREITILDLLTHTSGITSQDESWLTAELFTQELEPFLRPETCLPHPDMTLGDEIKILAKLPLSFQPGTAFGYGWSYDVLGYLVEVVSGKTIDEFFKERIFIPLRMKDTCFFLPEEKLFRFTAVYRPNTGGGLKLADSPSKSSWVRGPKRYFIPRGGLVSTVSDYARFSQMLLNFGELEGVRLLSRKTVELMTMNHTSNFPVQSSLPGDAIEYRYRLGFRLPINMAEVGTIGSEGSYSHSGAFCTLFWIDPKEELILITMTQLTTCNRRFLEDLRVLAYQSIDD